MSEEEILGRLKMIQETLSEIQKQLDRIEHAQFDLKTKVDARLAPLIR